MAMPEKLRIAYEADGYGRFDCVGRLPDGSQFLAFVTGTFPTGEKYHLGNDWQCWTDANPEQGRSVRPVSFRVHETVTWTI